MLKQVVAGGYNPNAVKFDGTNDYLTRGADLTGIADSKSGIFSCWVRVDTEGNGRLLYSATGLWRFGVTKNSGLGFSISGKNAAGTYILQIATTANHLASAKWLHILASWDLAAAASYIYINDVADQTVTTRTNDTIDYATSTPNWGVGADSDGATKHNGALSELYFAPGQYLDFSVESNRRKFIDAAGLPVSLGADGSTPTGTAPIIYLKGDYSAFGTNSGSGGNFTVNGALEKASTTPATLPAFNAVDFDGSADYLNKTTDLSGTSDSKKGIASFWARIDGGDSALRLVFNGQLVGTGTRFQIQLGSDNKFRFQGSNASSVSVLDIKTSAAYTASPKYLHVLAAWDLTTSAVTHLYVSDVSDKTVTTATNDGIIDWTDTSIDWLIGASYGGGSYFSGAISELYFAPGQYLDFSIEANRRKFIDASGLPVSLGADGSVPTGTAPAIYLPNRAALVGTNAGAGGNFTINGAPKDANSTPVYYYAEPAKFDGTNDYMARGAGLTGASDGKQGTISFWIRVDSGDGTYRMLLRSATDTGLVQIYAPNNNNKIFIEGYSTAPAQVLKIQTNSQVLSGPVWRHVIASWDLATGVGQLYLDNTSDLAAGSVLTNTNIDYTESNWYVGADGTSGFMNKLPAAIADLWFNTTYLDISQSSNRAKFIDQVTLRPVPLGAKGELPTGSQPLLYLGRDYANFQTNLGSGGDFTVTGALERATTSPSDVRA